MCTINVIESLNSQYRVIIKTKLIFSYDEGHMKILYLGTERISKRWSRVYPNWGLLISQLNILFGEVVKKEA